MITPHLGGEQNDKEEEQVQKEHNGWRHRHIQERQYVDSWYCSLFEREHSYCRDIPRGHEGSRLQHEPDSNQPQKLCGVI